jgi:hypothetical protein
MLNMTASYTAAEHLIHLAAVEAGMTGANLHDNPHTAGTREHSIWFAAWHIGRSNPRNRTH